jgi:hypothetical protein
LRNHHGPPTVIHLLPKAPNFESEDAARKALQRKKRLQAWKETTKQDEIQNAEKVEKGQDKTENATANSIEMNDILAAISKSATYAAINHARSHTDERAEEDKGSDEATADSLQQELQNELGDPDAERRKSANVESSRSNQPQHDTPSMQDFLRKQHLQLLQHSSECQAPLGACPEYSRCDEMKSLWEHMLNCTNNNCDVKYCVYSRQILREYFKQVRQEKQFSDNNRQHGPTGVAQGSHDRLQERQNFNLANADDAQALKRRQLRVLMLEHASECTAEVGKCTAFPECDSIKSLWKHVYSCNDLNCAVSHCCSSRSILREQFSPMANQNIPQSNGSPSKMPPSAQRPSSDCRKPAAAPNGSTLEQKESASPMPEQKETEPPMPEQKESAPPMLEQNESVSPMLEKKESVSPKYRRHRLFQHQISIPLPTAATTAADSPSLTRDVSELSQKSQGVLLEDKQRKSTTVVKSKKKSRLTTHASLWDYDFDGSDSSDSEGDFHKILDVDVDIVGDGTDIWSKSLPREVKSMNLSLRETAAVQSRIKDMKDQIRIADTIIQNTAPAYLVHPSKCWMEVASNDQDTQRPIIAVPASEKNHATTNSAEAFLSLLKSICMKAYNNSNETANHYVVSFLGIIKDARSHKKPLHSSPFKLMKQVWTLIKCVTEPLDEIEREASREKLKKKFDVFLPQGYSMLSSNYFMYKDLAVCDATIGDAGFVQSCARTYLRFNHNS